VKIDGGKTVTGTSTVPTDQDAKAVAATLIRDVGFDPADAGRLRIARYLEAFALAMAQLAYEGRDRVPYRALKSRAQ
jgi:predicted dinucleotide-binding enzyme